MIKTPHEMKIDTITAQLRGILETPANEMRGTVRDVTAIGSRVAVVVALLEGSMMVNSTKIELTADHSEARDITKGIDR